MAVYSAVPAKTVGDLWTAEEHNLYVRDNFAVGVPALFTAKGDLAVASGNQAACGWLLEAMTLF